ncbi:MAG: pirin family protein [Bacteroidetes bacterium]|nr:pirin family protein [Bacteroidota bacterium]
MRRKNFLRTLLLGIPAISASAASLAGSTGNSGHINKNAAIRSISKIIQATRQKVSAELTVKRSIPTYKQRMIDPFILLDHFGPIVMEPGEGAFVPPHPHRGFEPVTFIFEGGAEHKDSLGNHAILNSGDVQWMTSGSGIVHQEDMGKNYKNTAGIMNGVQLWVNLPAKNKFTTPGYQNIAAKNIPDFEEDDGKVKVRIVAGEMYGVRGPAKTFTPIMAFMLTIKPGGQIQFPVPRSYNAFVHILEGSILLGDNTKVNEAHLVLYNLDGEEIYIKTDPKGNKITKLLFLAGEPINEPVVTYGPFVMNTKAEINQAYADYQAGKMGTIK